MGLLNFWYFLVTTPNCIQAPWSEDSELSSSLELFSIPPTLLSWSLEWILSQFGGSEHELQWELVKWQPEHFYYSIIWFCFEHKMPFLENASKKKNALALAKASCNIYIYIYPYVCPVSVLSPSMSVLSPSMSVHSLDQVRTKSGVCSRVSSSGEFKN